ncbi:hypothetical protein [Mucilaginibacter sp. FT3.2]|uniref:hypothetical protein n=1 Tax=Mucilaginibacter sp. FT3.2 TaxID=2723090 RepID=UPI00161D42E3|nr:hypothetical protein [Mucilaginibacter sp. FT3.2]MBB6235296.1 hypothetical protein [Mucilaginibacter sp. FT3.2]
MLKNELEILASDFIPHNGSDGVAQHKAVQDFSKVVSKSCGKVREAWAAAVFSDSNDDTLRRYFDFHFKFLSGLISENAVCQESDEPSELCLLMDHLLLFYGNFIDQQQPVSTRYFTYRLRLLLPVYERFNKRLKEVKINNALINCLKISLSPLYIDTPSDGLFLNALFYREELITALAVTDAGMAQTPEESLISVLMAFNFNHFRFFSYLREQVISIINGIPVEKQSRYLLELSATIQSPNAISCPCFDKRWSHICDMYKGWLVEWGTVLNLGSANEQVVQSFLKVPLNISVNYLGCMIRALYEAGFYGTVSLSAIFDHAAAVFTTKKQEHISRDSLSNAFYNISLPTAARMIRIFNNSSGFLKSRYFPV